MFDYHVRWYVSASWMLLVLVVFLSTNAVFTRNVTCWSPLSSSFRPYS